MTIRVSTPLNASVFLEANGFHPIYQSLLFSNEKLAFNVPDLTSVSNLIYSNQKQIRRQNEIIVAEKLEYLGVSDVTRDYLNYYYRDEGFLLAENQGDVEFSHTIPLSSGRRPWIFHCESFMPIFMPNLVEGGGSNWSPELHEMYLKILEDPLLTFIGSHLDVTLQNLRDVFQSTIINQKLVKTSISIPVTALHETLKYKEIDFLFICSFHQNINNFLYRGGFGVIRFSIDYLRQHKSGLIVFRTPKPTDEQMRKNGVDVQKLDALVKQGKIVWVEQMVSTDALQRLFQKTKFFLLPSTNLHSASLMQALKSGCVPVVGNAQGIEEFVQDRVNCLLLNGLVDHTKINFGRSDILAVNYKKIGAAYTKNVEQKLKDCFIEKDPPALSEYRNTFKLNLNNFDPQAFIDEIHTELTKRNFKPLGSHKKKSTRFSKKIRILSFDKRTPLFKSPPQPRILFWGEKAVIYEMSGMNYLVLIEKRPINAVDWRLKWGLSSVMSADFSNLLIGRQQLDMLVSSDMKYSFVTVLRIQLIFRIKQYMKNNFPMIFRVLAENNFVLMLYRKLS